MKLGGFRSFQNYVSRIKDLHVRAGFTWSPQHAMEASQGLRSVTRGQGPARQSAPLDVDQVKQLQLPPAAICSGGPINPEGVIVIGSAFLLREIELAFARARHMTLDASKLTVRLELPVAKNDPAAIGCARVWGCLCPADRRGEDSAMTCPYHTAEAHVLALQKLFGAPGTGELEGTLPLFPCVLGRTVSKESVVKTIEGVASRLGLAILDPSGSRRFGGHSLRVSGAQWLARRGIPMDKLKALARWSSDVVERYVNGANLEDLTAHARRLLSGETPPATMSPIVIDYGRIVEGGGSRHPDQRHSELDAGVREELQEVQAEVRKATEELRHEQERGEVAAHDIVTLREQLLYLTENHDPTLPVRVQQLESDVRTHLCPQLVVNLATRCLHAVAGSTTGPAAQWVTRCQWFFGRSIDYRFVAEASNELVDKWCVRCGFPRRGCT